MYLRGFVPLGQTMCAGTLSFHLTLTKNNFFNMVYLFSLMALIAIVWGADILVEGSVVLARRFRISDFVVGAIIVGIGTSMPELAVSAYGAWCGNADVAIGNVVGSNIFNVLAILGLTAALWPVAVTRGNMRFDMPVCLGVSVLALLLAFNFFAGGDVCIGGVDGLLLLALFAAFIFVSFVRDRRSVKRVDSVEQTEVAVCDVAPQPKIYWALLRIVCGLLALVVGSRFFVDFAVEIARAWGVDDAFISVTLLACGTSLPELAASLAAAFKHNTQLALGNIIGSNIFNITFILGISSLITPLSGGGVTMVDYIVMVVAAALPMLLGATGRIARWGGVLMVLCYVAYAAYLIRMQTI